MKIDKTIIIVAVFLIIIILFSIQKKKNQESGWWLFSKPKSPVTPTPSMAGCTSCWVSSIEDGVQYCRWYDQYGRNTSTYEGRGCTGTQANIGFGQGYGQRKKKWWESLFGL